MTADSASFTSEGTEYRVLWWRQRRRYNHNTNAFEPINGKDRSVKRFGTPEGAEKFRLVLLGRGHEAYGVDPDEPWCCGGEDGCGGLTNREHYAKVIGDKGVAPLVGEPIIESRPYGAWASNDRGTPEGMKP